MTFNTSNFPAYQDQFSPDEKESHLVFRGPEPTPLGFFAPDNDPQNNNDGGANSQNGQVQPQSSQPDQSNQQVPSQSDQLTPGQQESKLEVSTVDTGSKSQETHHVVGHTISSLIHDTWKKYANTLAAVGSVAVAPVAAPLAIGGYIASKKVPGVKTVTSVPRAVLEKGGNMAVNVTAKGAMAAPFVAEQLIDGAFNINRSRARTQLGKLVEKVIEGVGNIPEYAFKATRWTSIKAVNLAKGAFELVTEPIKQVFKTYGAMLKSNPIPTVIGSLALWGWLGPGAGVYTPEAATKTVSALGYVWDKLLWLLGVGA